MVRDPALKCAGHILLDISTQTGAVRAQPFPSRVLKLGVLCMVRRRKVVCFSLNVRLDGVQFAKGIICQRRNLAV